MTLYKLTDENHQTRNNTQWGPGIAHRTNGKGELCGPGWIHAYQDPRLAIFFDPIHGQFGDHSVLWLAEGEGKFLDDNGFKCGVTELTTIKIISKPEIRLEQRIEFVIRCSKQVYNDINWNHWADRWLDGSDRSTEKAYAVAMRAPTGSMAEWSARMAAEAPPEWAIIGTAKITTIKLFDLITLADQVFGEYQLS